MNIIPIIASLILPLKTIKDNLAPLSVQQLSMNDEVVVCNVYKLLMLAKVSTKDYLFSISKDTPSEDGLYSILVKLNDFDNGETIPVPLTNISKKINKDKKLSLKQVILHSIRLTLHSIKYNSKYELIFMICDFTAR